MRVLVVYCHPVPDSFCAAVRDAAVGTLTARGWDVRLVDLYAEGFDPVLGSDERRHYHDRAPTDPALAPHIENLKWAEAVLFVYPTWWYGLPAMLKGWLDRVWATDVAFKLPADGGRIISLVPHITRIGVVTTCGATWLISFLMGQPGRKTILRGMRALCAPRSRTLYVAHYDMDRSTAASRAAYLEKVRRRLEKF
ncbi:NAD(P)H-dependent oxidoreductase [Mesorhizobium sp. AaZ16]|uniref:NAD(P)H-dependent oxidoreductase n=1 Tax=Mesorhizobium sp. AaZ16 TaxID=3402289 RepID=UPI00374E8C7D